MSGRGCAFEGCPNPPRTKGWCQKHWRRIRKYGDPGIVGRAGNPSAASPHGSDPACTCRFDGVCCCLTAGQVSDYVEGGDNARWLALPTLVEGAA